jgi:glucose/mannose transport system substrate-binding protein
MRVSRLMVLPAVLALVAAAACGDNGDNGELGESPADDSAVEVFSWWTAGGEADGLEAMIAVFNEEYPEYEFVNAAVAGGAGTAARAVLASRLAAGDPPSSWQGHAGQELIGTYVAANQLEPLNFLFDEEGWLDVLPEAIIPQISHEGNIYSVPVNIHRANVLWYVPEQLDSFGVDVPQTWDEFFTVAEQLDAQGVTPLAMGEQWTAMHLFETVLLGTMSVAEYDGLWDGTTDWDGPQVSAAIEVFERALSYTNPDASTLSWDQAAQLVIDGDAAFTIMGDWAAGYFTAQGLAPSEDGYGWAPVPGTGGVFQWLSDSFVLPVNAHNRDGAIAWLRVAGSQAGQDAFNPVKGSIPARTDGDRGLYDDYLLSAMDDWESDQVTGSLTHGTVASDPYKAEIDTALGLYLADGDAAGLQQGLVAACQTAGVRTGVGAGQTGGSAWPWWHHPCCWWASSCTGSLPGRCGCPCPTSRDWCRRTTLSGWRSTSSWSSTTGGSCWGPATRWCSRWCSWAAPS